VAAGSISLWRVSAAHVLFRLTSLDTGELKLDYGAIAGSTAASP
jgi:hypothetical protein